MKKYILLFLCTLFCVASGLWNLFDLPQADYYCENGMRATSAMNYKGFKLTEHTIGTLEAAFSQKTYDTIYVMFGTNDLAAGQADAGQFADA